MLTCKKIEGALRGHVASPGLSIREALETALALYQENERLKKLDAANIVYMQGQVEENGTLKAENARLLKELDETEKLLSLLGEDCPKLQTKIQKLEIENARLREADESAKRVIDGLVATQDILQRDIDLLWEVVEAAATLACDMHTICREEEKTPPERFVGYYDACHDICNAICELKKAALEGLEGK